MAQLIRGNTVFHVSDIQASIDFYTRYLGFEIDFQIGDPVVYAGLTCGDFCLHIGSQIPERNDRGHGNIYLILDEVDALFRSLKQQPVEIIRDVADQEFGLRDFVLLDPDGNQIGIGAQIET